MGQKRHYSSFEVYQFIGRGSLYFAVVLDLFYRKVIGWSIKSTLAKECLLFRENYKKLALNVFSLQSKLFHEEINNKGNILLATIVIGNN